MYCTMPKFIRSTYLTTLRQFEQHKIMLKWIIDSCSLVNSKYDFITKIEVENNQATEQIDNCVSN